MTSDWTPTVAGAHLRGRRVRDTTPELELRRELHRMGARFRLHRRLASGCTADLVLPARGIAVFVDGDFWHSCPVHGKTGPWFGPNAELWEAKMLRNRERDLAATKTATAAGWTVVRVWECTVLKDPVYAATSVLAGVTPSPV